MGLVRIEEWLSERGLLRAPGPGEDPGSVAQAELSELEALRAQIMYQVDLISRLQNALRGLLDELQRRDMAQAQALAATQRAAGPGRVTRRVREVRSSPATIVAPEAPATPVADNAVPPPAPPDEGP